MHFLLAKVGGFLSVPSNLIASIAVVALCVLAYRRPAHAIVPIVALLLLVTATLSPLGNMLLTPLEQRFPELQFPDQGIEGIIVLGGSYDAQSHSYLSTILLREDTEPMAVIPDLARRYPKARIIFSGGTEPTVNGINEAAIVKKYFISFGIAADRIEVEDQSQTTSENARLTAQMIHPTPQSRWLLVASAYHMPRAMGAFRKAGFNVLAFPVGNRTHGWGELWIPAPDATDNLRRIDVAVHEWLGLVTYRLSGYSNDWFPAPGGPTVKFGRAILSDSNGKL